MWHPFVSRDYESGPGELIFLLVVVVQQLFHYLCADEVILECPPQGPGLGRVLSYGRLAVAHAACLPAPRRQCCPREGHQRRRRSCQSEVGCNIKLPLGLRLLITKPFSILGLAARQRRFEIRVFPLLDGWPSQADEFHLPDLLLKN